MDYSRPLKRAKHERYAQLLLDQSSQAAAYREVYPASANWKPKTVYSRASELARKVKGRVDWLLEQTAKQSVASAEGVLDRLWQIATVELADYAIIVRGKVRFKSFEEMTPAARAALDGNGKPHNALKALEMLARHFGLFEKDNSQGSQVDGLQKLLREIDRNA